MDYNKESNTFYFILLIVIILTVLYIISILTIGCTNNKEGWFNYKELNGKINEGCNHPTNFYKYTYYREPYRWPLGFNTQNPIPHTGPILDKLQN